MAKVSDEFESILEIYSFEEVLEMNDLTPRDALEFLVEEGLVELPEVRPLREWEDDLKIVDQDDYET